MARHRIRHFAVRNGRNGSNRYFWSPSPALRRSGWCATRLPDTKIDAYRMAEALNAAVDHWRQGKLVADLDSPYLQKAYPIRSPYCPKEAHKDGQAPYGTLSALIAAYRQSSDFPTNGKTRIGYEDNLHTLMDWDLAAGHPALELIGPKDFKALWTAIQAKTPTKARAVISMARIVLNWGLREELYSGYLTTTTSGETVRMSENPAAKLRLKTIKVQRDEDDLWSDDEITAFVSAADAAGWFSVGTAVFLNGWCGQRQADVLALSRASYAAGRWTVRQQKTGALVSLPVDMVPSLADRFCRQIRAAEALAPDEAHMLICETTAQPWKADHFRHVFSVIREKVAQQHPSITAKKFMLLRHTAVVRLAEAGCEVPEIASISGHTLASVTQILERYHVRTRLQAERAFRKRIDVDQK